MEIQKPFPSVNNRIGIRWAAKDLQMDVIPSSDKIETVEDALIWILKFGYPIVMRTLRTPSQKISDEKEMWKIEEALEKGPIVLERFLENAREIETVMFGIKGELPVCLGEGEISQNSMVFEHLLSFHRWAFQTRDSIKSEFMLQN